MPRDTLCSACDAGIELSDDGNTSAMAIAGWVDSIDDNVVRGWAYNPGAATHAEVEIWIGERLIGSALAAEYRSDLAAAGVGDGHCGFTFQLPDFGSETITVRAIHAANGETLNGGIRILSDTGLSKSDVFSGVLSRGRWMVHRIRTDGEFVVEGWAVPPFGMPMEFAISHNGTLLELVSCVPSAEAATRFDIPPGSGAYDFIARGPLVPGSSSTAAHVFEFVNPRTGEPFDPHQSVALQIEHDGPIPDEDRRKRVGGSSDLLPFLQQGLSAYLRLDQVLGEYFGSSFSASRAILDWGSGCGRVFSHLPVELLERLTGIDIDAGSVAWCRSVYPAARFETIELDPPTPLPTSTYDVIFGISVFTHLLEPAAEAWLQELHRLSAPGGAILVTVLGDVAWANAGFSLNRFIEFRASGFYNAGKNTDLDDAQADASQYYNTFVSRRYIYEKWSQYFEVLDVIAGSIGNHQDLVVLRRRPN